MPVSPRDQPALPNPPERSATGRVIDGGFRECMVLFRDGTTRLCKAVSWQQDGDGWRVLLQWGVSGRVQQQWYVHDPRRVDAGPG